MHGLHDALLNLTGLSEQPSALLSAINGEFSPVYSAAWVDPYWAGEVGGRLASGYRMMRDGDHAVIISDTGGIELFDVTADPGWQHDLSQTQPDRAAALRDRLLEAIPALESTGDTVQTSSQTLQALQELGYIE